MLHLSIASHGHAGHAASESRGRPRRRRLTALALGLLVVAMLVLLLVPATAVAMPVQFFYVPFPEDQLLTMMTAVELGGPSNAPTNPITSYITITAVADGTIVYYDQWENGYDIDIANTYNVYTSANLGGTQIWGDGDSTNGAPPNIPTDVIDAGTVIQLTNDIYTTNLLAIDFDGRDKIAATKTIAITRSSWAGTTGTLFAGCVEVFDTNNWGTDYRAPVGTNIADSVDGQMYEYTALSIMAGQDGAYVSADTNNDGDYTDTGELNGYWLAEGASTYVTNVYVGGHVTSTRPVQVDIYTGDIASNYESRDSALMPTNFWGQSYYSPVSTPDVDTNDGDERTTVWLYNPNAWPISVAYDRRDSSDATVSSTIGVPAGGVAKRILDNAADGTGSHFYSVTAPPGIEIDATTSAAQTGSTAASLTWSHTTGTGANRLLLVGVAIAEDGTQRNVTGITYGGVALTYMGRQISASGGSNNNRSQVEIWALANPASGTANVVVSLSGARAFAASATTFDNVDVSNGLTSALGSFVSAIGTNGTQTVNVATSAGQYVYDVVAATSYSRNTDPAAFTVGANQTQLWTQLVRTAASDRNGYRARCAGSFEIATGSTTTMSWSSSTSYPWAIAAVPINKASSTATLGDFYAFSATDAASTTTGYNQAWDWSFTMIPEWMLTTQALVGLGIGRDPTSATNPDENGNPVWVTPVGNGDTPVTVYVDYDADPSTGTYFAGGYGYDDSYSLMELQQARIYHQGNPGIDQTGMLVYTLDQNVKLAAAWGQDPQTSQASAPGLDVGTSVPPMPEYTAGKDGLLYDVDNDPANGYTGDSDGDGYITCGDEIEWPITVLNVSRIPVPDVIVQDVIPDNTTYVANSTYLWTDANDDGVLDTSAVIPDNTTGTPFPLDGTGFNYGTLLVGDTFTVKFRVVIADLVDLAPGTTAIMNNGHALALGWDDPVDDRVYLRARLGDFVWYDENANGIQDTAETGIAEVTVTLFDGSGNIVRDDQGNQMTSITTDTGAYDFRGLLPGTYRVEFLLPPNDPVDPNDDTEITTRQAGSDATKDSDPYLSTDATNPCRTDTLTLVGGEWNHSIDAGIIMPNNNPTQVVVGFLDAYAAADKVVVSWETTSETRTAGYYVERKEGDEWVRVNKALVPALFESEKGGTYSVVDQGAVSGQTLTYRLVEIERQGDRLIYGPYEVTADTPLPDDRGAGQLLSGQPWARIAKTPKLQAQGIWKPWQTPGPVVGATQLKIEVTAEGLYRIDAVDIASALGMTETKVRSLIQTAGLKLTNRGKTVTYHRPADRSCIYFYAEPLDSIYTAANVYWLTQARGMVMADPPGRTSSGDPTTSFADSVHVEQNLFAYPAGFVDAEADFWLWDYVDAGEVGADVMTIDVDAPGGLEGTSLTVSLQGMTSLPQVNEHHVQVSLNGTLLGDAWWSGTVAYDARFSIPAGLLLAGANQVDVKAVLDPGVDYSAFAIESLDLEYQRATGAVDDQLLLSAPTTGKVHVDDLSTTAAWVFDITAPVTPQLVKTNSTGGDPGDAWLTFPGLAGHRYLVATAAGALTPAALTPVAPSQFRSSGVMGAQYVVITSPALTEAAGRLAAYRSAQGLKSMVVTTNEIYDFFNYGIIDPHAIRSFVTYATTKFSRKAAYVVFAGDGSYDYRNYAGFNDSLVPPLMVHGEQGLSPSDVALVDVKNNDGVPEVAFGRLSALDSTDLDIALGKIQAYESAEKGAWRQSVLFAADNSDDGGDFSTASDNLAATLPRVMKVSKAYLGGIGLDAARAALRDGFAGSLLISYVGHSAIDRWAEEQLLVNADVPGLPGSDQLPIVGAFTCVAGRFGLPGSDCLSEALAKQAGMGAIAVFSPTAMEQNEDSVRLAGFFNRSLFDGVHQAVLGKAVIDSLKAGAAAGLPVWMLQTYCLLGDPALKVTW